MINSIKGTLNTSSMWIFQDMRSSPPLIYLYSIKKVSPPITFFPNAIIADNIYCLYICTWVILLGCILLKTPTIVDTDIKQVSPILYFRIFYFELMMPFYEFCQYYVIEMSSMDFNAKISIDNEKPNRHFSQ